MKRFNWDDFRVFLGVARAESALEAAQSLGLDQSTISRRLYRLEKDMGAKLFDRSPQGHRLTTAGHRLLDHVEKLESTFTEVEADVLGDSVELTGEIRLGATEAFGSYFLAPHLAHFCTQHPAITVDLLPMPRNINLSKRGGCVSDHRTPHGGQLRDKPVDRLSITAVRHAGLFAHPSTHQGGR